MTVLLTGAAGFIGFHVARALLDRGEQVVGVDNLNSYYDVRLKQARLAQLRDRPGFAFLRLDLADKDAVLALAADRPEVTHIVHLAAQAGVRFSMRDPFAYVSANVLGHLSVLEAARRLPRLRHLVYASSSSVYGGNTEMPFAEADRVDRPLSVYAATKRADELLSYAYGHLYSTPQTGLRFFTVYGPWGRPDMAYYAFARAISAGEPIELYDDGAVRRDFTYIDDAVAAVLATLDRPPAADTATRLLNIGHHRSERVDRLVALLEAALGRRAIIRLVARPASDPQETLAATAAATQQIGFTARISLDEGIPRFAAWFRDFAAMSSGRQKAVDAADESA